MVNFFFPSLEILTARAVEFVSPTESGRSGVFGLRRDRDGGRVCGGVATASRQTTKYARRIRRALPRVPIGRGGGRRSVHRAAGHRRGGCGVRKRSVFDMVSPPLGFQALHTASS